MISHNIDLLHKVAFHNKFAEATCESLGLAKSVIHKAYREVEGIVGFIDATRRRQEILNQPNQEQCYQQEEQQEGEESEQENSKSKPIVPAIDYDRLSSLIFTDGEAFVAPLVGDTPYTEQTRREVFQSVYYEMLEGSWPKNWFRKVGRRKAQLQIPLANLLPPACYRDDEENDNGEDRGAFARRRHDEEKNNERNDDGDRTKKTQQQQQQQQQHQEQQHELPPRPRSAILLPPNLQKIAVHFERILSSYLEKIVVEHQLVPSAIQKGLFPGLLVSTESSSTCPSLGVEGQGRSKLLEKMRSKSVLRLWIYFGDDRHGEGDDDVGESCRGHFDPGLCTILLSGSRPGLQVNRTFVGRAGVGAVKPLQNNSGDNSNKSSSSFEYEYATHDSRNQANAQDWITIGFAPAIRSIEEQERGGSSASPSYSSSNVVLMNDTMMQLLSGGMAEHAFHRVTDDVGPASPFGSQTSRIQIVLELRPDNPHEWYTFIPTEDEKKQMANFL